jgi:hypothetical protein
MMKREPEPRKWTIYYLKLFATLFSVLSLIFLLVSRSGVHSSLTWVFAVALFVSLIITLTWAVCLPILMKALERSSNTSD